MMEASTILVAGSANLDFVVRAHAIPSPGETVLGREFRTFPGGKGANQAVAAARAGGADVRMLLALGDDPAARVLEDSLHDAGVALEIRRQASSPTGVAFICISDSAENAITVAPGANDALLPGDLPTLEGVSHLLLQLETPVETVTAYAERARTAGVVVVLNAAPARTLPRRLLDAVDILIVNEGELALLAGEQGTLADAMHRLDARCVVVTLGDSGCIALDAGEFFLQPAFPVDAIDTTAAGDTFCGSLVAVLSRGESLASALREAGAASALACTGLGAQSSIPARDAVRILLEAGMEDPAAIAALSMRCGLPMSTSVPRPPAQTGSVK